MLLAFGVQDPTPLRRRLIRLAFVLLYACATLQFIRFYVISTTFYLDLPAYLAGRERLPFQERILPALLMRWFYRSPLLHYSLAHTSGAFTGARAPFFLISLASIAVAAFFVQRLYRAVSSSGALSFLVYPVFLFCMMWTYTIHTEANFSYPYDMLAVAFFSAGLYFIYCRQYWPLAAVVLIGTFNRETTLFLIGIYVLDAAVGPLYRSEPGPAKLLLVRAIPWLRVGVLCALWIAVKASLSHVFAHNSNSENYVRIHDNIKSLNPRLWPALLNVCGYMLPIVVLLNNFIQNRRFRAYLWILPLWFAIMFWTGVIVETRIYGELCPYVAIALVLIMERRVAVAYRQVPMVALEPRASLDLAA